MVGKLIIEGNAVYEIDEACLNGKRKDNEPQKAEEERKKQRKHKQGGR